MSGLEKVEFGDLCEELVVEIFDRIPLKAQVRMKCVSKGWRSLISRVRQLSTRTSASTLIYLYEIDFQSDKQVIFLNAREQGGEKQVHEHNSLGFSMSRFMKCMGSSNGLLLFCEYNEYPVQVRTFVCNPTLNQWVSLPLRHYAPDFKGYVVSGLAFDGSQYKVVSFIYRKADPFAYRGDEVNRTGYIEFEIFSSNTGVWIKHTARFLNSSLLLTRDVLVMYLVRPIFWNGMLLCILEDHMLVCNFENNIFKLTELPKKTQDKWVIPGFLWESEGCIHYCYSYIDGFRIWKYIKENFAGELSACVEEDQNHSDNWKLTHTAELVRFIAKHPEIYGSIEMKFYWILEDFFKPCSFDEDLQMMYIQLPRMLLCYSLETRKLKKVWEFEESKCIWSSRSCSHLMQLSGVNVPLAGDCKLFFPESESPESSGRPRLSLEGYIPKHYERTY